MTFKVPAPRKRVKRSKHADISEESTYGFRGAGATWQADFGQAISEADLLFAVRREPIARKAVFKVAQDIFSKWISVEEVAEKPDPNWSREVGTVLDEIGARTAFAMMAVYERLFGWAILALTYVDSAENVSEPVSDGKEIREVIAYSSIQATVQGSDEEKNVESERYGLPNYYTLNRFGANQTKLHFSRVIHCATRLLDHPWKGQSVLEVLYDDLTVLRNERWGLGQTLVRYGSGFPDIEISDTNKTKVSEFIASHDFSTIHSGSFFVHGADKKLEFKGLAGKTLNPEPYIDPVIQSLSCGTDVPEAILRGAQAGALAGSEVNEREYFGFITSLRALYEPYLWDLIDRLMDTGQIKRVEDYRIKWLGGVELSEKDQAAVELQEAQARNLRSGWMTVDELRAEEGKDPLPNGAGAVVLGVKKTEQESFGGSQPSPGVVSEDEIGPFTWIFSKLRRKKQDANDKK